MKSRLLLSLLLLFLPLCSMFADDNEGNTYTTPERLFHISRSANKNLVCYDFNLKDGQLDSSNPINVYWVNREEHPGKKDGLSFIQRKMAYGYKVVDAKPNQCRCTLTAYPKKQLTITKLKEGGYACLVNINQQPAILKSLYVKASAYNPLSVEYVVLKGISLKSHKPVQEVVKK